jgi:hypothetical protein
MFEITATYPTPLLQDFKTFMDNLKQEEALLSNRNQYLARKRLWELNQQMGLKVENVTPKLDQHSYPLLHMFYHLALVGKLIVMLPGKGGKFSLKVTERYEEYLNLTMAEQYFFLLETLWIDADWEELQKSTRERIPDVWFIASVWYQLAKSNAGETLLVKDRESPWHKLWDWGYFLWYFTYFGFWQFTQDDEALKLSRRNVEAVTITPTDFGVSIASILFIYRDYLDWNEVNLRKGILTSQDVIESVERSFRDLGKKPQGLEELARAREESLEEPFFMRFIRLVAKGELMHTLLREEQDFIEGTYLFKVSLSRGIWRKIEMAAKHTLDQLHLAIQEAFEFDNDHLYSFFMDNKRFSYERYNSPHDEEGPFAGEVMLGELGLYPGKTFLYLFDYGDEWEFKVEVEEINSDKPLPISPKIVGKRGEAPAQYPDWD